MRKSWVFGLLFFGWVIFNCHSIIAGAAGKPAKLADVYFGFADETGTRVVANDDEIGLKTNVPSRITKVIGPGGRVLSLGPLKYQEESPKSNGRQNYFNFDYCGGYYSRLTGGKLESGVACVFVTDDFLKQWRIIKFQSGGEKPAKCTPAIIKAFENAKKVKVADSLELARYGASQICLFMFKKASTPEYVGNLVLMVDNRIACEDNPLDQVGDGAVGDEPGSLEDCRSRLGCGRYCDALNIFSNGKDTMILLQDGSEESNNLNLVMVGNKGFQSVKFVSWYSAPL